LYKEQTSKEEAVQKVIKQTALIGNTSTLFSELEAKCNSHNMAMTKQQLQDYEDLTIRLQFTNETSEDIIDSSMHSQLETAKSLLEKVDESIKNKLSE